MVYRSRVCLLQFSEMGFVKYSLYSYFKMADEDNMNVSNQGSSGVILGAISMEEIIQATVRSLIMYEESRSQRIESTKCMSSVVQQLQPPAVEIPLLLPEFNARDEDDAVQTLYKIDEFDMIDYIIDGFDNKQLQTQARMHEFPNLFRFVTSDEEHCERGLYRLLFSSEVIVQNKTEPENKCNISNTISINNQEPVTMGEPVVLLAAMFKI
ncbi:hypothetical protein FQR65_LT11857 [Abscondita terminalis]|nr:hypothetical protein FQR65_LT11857 [Abscondita terminalis]